MKEKLAYNRMNCALTTWTWIIVVSVAYVCKVKIY